MPVDVFPPALPHLAWDQICRFFSAGGREARQGGDLMMKSPIQTTQSRTRSLDYQAPIYLRRVEISEP